LDPDRRKQLTESNYPAAYVETVLESVLVHQFAGDGCGYDLNQTVAGVEKTELGVADLHELNYLSLKQI
jgi:hypothetical protein